MATRRKGPACALVLSLFAAAAFAALMQHSETTIPMPGAGEKTPLAKLEYRARFVASIDSVTVQVKSDAGADPVVADWTFTGSNTDGQAHRVEVVVRLPMRPASRSALLGDADPASLRSRLPDHHATKAKADAWTSARKARIVAD